MKHFDMPCLFCPHIFGKIKKRELELYAIEEELREIKYLINMSTLEWIHNRREQQ